ncbi:MAG: site-2 protease family protein [Candidatus Harrisonbacteria bacterium]|nr:site-2 protease family protein [Candidatus Harrisonbacteria bacterium]
MFEILSILFIVLGLSVLVIIHEAGHFFASKWFGLWVEEFGFGLPPRLWGKKIGETLYSFNWLPFGGFVKIYGENRTEQSEQEPARSFNRQPLGRRAAVIGAGVVMNFLLGWVLLSAVFMTGIPRALLVTEVKAGGIADLAGIKKGDQLTDFKSVSELIESIDENKGQEVSLNVKRGKEQVIIIVMPRLAVPEGEGNLGIYLTELGLPQSGILESFWRGLVNAASLTKMIFFGIADLIVGVFTDISILERFMGPVGIINVAVETTKLGAAHFLQLLALISLNLAVFNVFPIPALDGGRLFLLLVEKIKGSPLNPKIEMAVNGLGFAFLLFLILTITVKDILALL